MSKSFCDSETDPRQLKERTAAVVGYGNQGRTQAFNMRTSLREALEELIWNGRFDQQWRAQESETPAIEGLLESLFRHSAARSEKRFHDMLAGHLGGREE